MQFYDDILLVNIGDPPPQHHPRHEIVPTAAMSDVTILFEIILTEYNHLQILYACYRETYYYRFLIMEGIVIKWQQIRAEMSF